MFDRGTFSGQGGGEITERGYFRDRGNGRLEKCGYARKKRKNDGTGFLLLTSSDFSMINPSPYFFPKSAKSICNIQILDRDY